MNEDQQYTLLAIIGFLLLLAMTSCSTSRIAHTPTRREINRAMKYSTSDYAQPRMETNLSQRYNPEK